MSKNKIKQLEHLPCEGTAMDGTKLVGTVAACPCGSRNFQLAHFEGVNSVRVICPKCLHQWELNIEALSEWSAKQPQSRAE